MHGQLYSLSVLRFMVHQCWTSMHDTPCLFVLQWDMSNFVDIPYDTACTHCPSATCAIAVLSGRAQIKAGVQQLL